MADSTLEFGPYRLRTRPDRLLRGAETVALRPKSLSVLAYLAARPGRLVTKEELREQVWGAAHVSDTALRVTVREIRAAVGDTGKQPAYLATVPTRGWRLETKPARARSGRETPPPGQHRVSEEPVVGRRREIRGLMERLEAVRAGTRQLVGRS